jgi:hypothetical protein
MQFPVEKATFQDGRPARPKDRAEALPDGGPPPRDCDRGRDLLFNTGRYLQASFSPMMNLPAALRAGSTGIWRTLQISVIHGERNTIVIPATPKGRGIAENQPALCSTRRTTPLAFCSRATCQPPALPLHVQLSGGITCVREHSRRCADTIVRPLCAISKVLPCAMHLASLERCTVLIVLSWSSSLM